MRKPRERKLICLVIAIMLITQISTEPLLYAQDAQKSEESMEVNGEHTFDVINSDGQEAASKTIMYTDLPNVDETGEFDSSENETGEFVIRSEEDLEQINANPSGTFILEGDIELTSDSLKDVDFTGTLDGKGYMIRGFTESLFNSVKDAIINNIVMKGSLAKTSTNSTITNAGFYVEASDDEKDAAVIIASDNTIIQHSFAFMNVAGKRVSGFIVEGTGTIENSYVSGYLKGNEVYGFGKDTAVKNSYINASLVGEERTFFTNGEIEACFYDAQINDLEDLKATPMYTKDMISKDFINEGFKVVEGQYPQIQNIEEMKEAAQEVSTLSVQSVKADSNLSALEGQVVTEDTEGITWDKEKEEVSAKSNDYINRFALRNVEAITSITAGESTTATTTQITYPITMGKYYKVLKASEVMPTPPADHKIAIESGWKIMYWGGSYKQAGLDWNTKYNVYSVDAALTAVVNDGTVTTTFGKNGGKLTLSGTYDENQVMTATLSGTNTNKGTMYFERAKTLDASKWTQAVSIPMDGTSTMAAYTVNAADKGNYLRARFEADQTTGYQGTVIDKTKSVFKEEISGVTIVNKTTTNGTYTLNDQLVANITPTGKENDVIFKWYHEGGSEPIATGQNYTIKGSDINKKLFVRAEAKTDGDFKDSKDSVLTSEVQPIRHNTPTATDQLKEVSKDDITVTLTMDVAGGLYRYGYRVTGTSTAITPYSILARNKTKTTITGLNPNTGYDFYVQEVGENGYGDSDWSTDYIQITTDKEHVKGDVVVSGDTIYDQTLKATLTNNSINQTGQFVWYRLNDDGTKTKVANTVDTYKLAEDDIGMKIEVAYEGNGNYAGVISTITDTIIKKENNPPRQNLTSASHTDTTITVRMPGIFGARYIIGISRTKNGVPIELVKNGNVVIGDPDGQYTITGLERDTEYFLFLRTAEDVVYQKSEWISAEKAIMVKTDTKAFTGNIVFKYQTTNLMRGQTLTANLNPTDTSFNYKGEWKWTRIDAVGKETDINNFALTNNKQGTQYVVPMTEELDVTYKVTFTANVGFTGGVNATSSKVHDIVKEQYQAPDPDFFDLQQIDDTSIRVGMVADEGKYRFWYKKADQTPWDSVKGFFNKMFVDPNDGFREVKSGTDTGVDVLANSTIEITGLDRNTSYFIKAQRVGDDKGTTSELSWHADMSTASTEIAGHVTIEGTTRFDQTLTAKYNAATYASTGSGSDTEGTWQWYRGSTKITNANSATYKLVEADINQVLTAKYTMPAYHNFKGQVEEKSDIIQKAMGVSPSITGITSKEVSGKMTMTVTGTLGTGGTDSVYYRLQKASDSAPTNVPTYGSSVPAGWHKVDNPTMVINKDCNNLELVANTEYTIYFIKIATATAESTAQLSQSHKMGTHQQIGTITFTKPTETTKQAFVVGQTVKANLSTGSNSSGTWKWYMSTTKYNGSSITTAPAATATSSWKEITSGFSQTSDNRGSELNLSEEMFGYFIRSEFVAGDESGFSGSISSTESQYVRKVYDEKLTITSSTKDGNGNPKAYTNTVITGTIDNYAESGNLNRATVRFKVGTSTYLTPTITNGTFTYTMPNNASYDAQEITAEVSTPRIIGLYVDTNLKAMATKTLNSKTSTTTSMLYTAGVPISNADDLENFMKALSPYNDRSATSKYVVTNHINMSSKGVIVYAETNFAGTLNGDLHTIVGTKNPLFALFKGTSAKHAEVNNLIMNQSNINTTNLTGGAGSASVIARQAGYTTIKNVLVVNSQVRGGWDSGLLLGQSEGALIIEQSGSAGGYLESPIKSATGGFIGWTDKAVSSIRDSFSINSTIKDGTASGSGSQGGFIGGGRMIRVYNSFSSAKLEFTNDRNGGLIGSGNSSDIIISNGFYDNTLSPNPNLNSATKGTGKSTLEMVGGTDVSGKTIQNYFDGTSKDIWSYKDGFYPQLTWLKNNSIATLYSATRGAFTSVDGATSSTNMFNGRIYGSIQIPAELLTKDFTVTSSNPSVLKVKDNGTIIPVNRGTATITITYKEPDTTIGGSASNSFEFTAVSSKEEITLVEILNSSTGTTLTNPNSVAPKMNQLLTIRHPVAEAFGPTYKWYRRKGGSTVKELIAGATAKTYTVKASDVGYEISVLVSVNPFAATYSNYTKQVEFITPTGPSVTSITDSSVKLNANGNSAFKYEFGYLRADQNALITQVEGAHAYNASVTVNNLQRNKNYKFYTRIAEVSDKSYPASEWSPTTLITTTQTTITGTPQLGTAINNGTDLSLNMATTNGQTGTWKLERMEANGTTKKADITFTSSDNETKYILTTADVGYRIRATFTGSGDFKGTTSSVLSNVIQKAASTAPSAPTEMSKNDANIVIKMADAGTYDIAYAEKSPTGTKTVIDNVSGQINKTISGLSRNTDYYIFARKSETSGNVASAWSDYLHVKTAKTNVSGTITQTGTAKVEENITFTMPHSTSLNVDFTGTWKLERVSGTGTSEVSTTISPSKYTVAYNIMTYKVDPKDAGSILRATYTGNGDFQGSKNKSTLEIANAEQGGATATNGVISDVKDHSLKVRMKEGAETYQFGYRQSSASNITTVDSIVVSGTDVLIEGLQRNSLYVIYVRHAAKTGYNASGWSSITTNQKTEKSVLTGTVEYVKVENGNEVPAKVGAAEVNATYKAEYLPGTYNQTGTDTAGHWQWYADGNAIPGATNATYTIEPMTNVDEITVRFIANNTSDFTGYCAASIGTLTKPAYEPPTTLPTVTAKVEDGTTGSKLFIGSSEIDNVFYYVQKADNAKVPATTLASEVVGNSATTDQWFKANASMTLNLEANTSYVVYVARLEDGSHLSSGVISQRAVKTVKDDISKISSISITEADTTLNWKVLQDKELRINRDGKPVEGIWQYYVTQTKDIEASWQNITAEVNVNSTEGNESTYTYTRVNVPLKYANSYYFRAVFTGRGDLEGSEIYTSNVTLIGTQLKGSARLSTGNTSQVFVPINANYIYAKDNGQDIVDEENGIWTWYREETGDDTKIKTGTVGISDAYTPTAEDVGKKIYAIYSGAPKGIYSGSVTSNTLSNVTRATQNAPDAIEVKQVSGTSVQINLPTNMVTTGKTIAQPELEYRIKGTTDWITNTTGNAWITGLKANTEYEVRVLFVGTSEYLPSPYGATITVKTGNQSFNEENLKITQPNIFQSGDLIGATYSGSGYDEGYFVIKRSDGTVIKDRVEGTVTKGFAFKSSSTKIQYQSTNDDIGSNIIIEFKAKADATTYGGAIEKSTKEVVKPINPVNAGTPVLNTIQYSETSLKVEVNDANEYVLNESATAVSETSGDWQKLTNDTGQTYHTFTGLSKTKAYYLHVRTAETENYRYSKEDVSAATKPWARTQYTITYEGMDGATNGNPTNPTQYTELSTEIKLNDPSKNGYTFTGWTTDTIPTPTKELTIPIHSSGDKKFTANWDIITYNIKYSGEGAALPVNPTTYTVETDTFTLTNPTRDGYTFAGWTYTGETTPQMSISIPKGTFGEKEYTANWTINQYTAVFAGNEGTDGTDITVDYNTKLGTLPTSSRTGYTFAGWFTSKTGGTKVTTDTLMPLNGATYYAHWIINQYTISFDSNGGSAVTTTIKKDYDTALGTLPTATKKGHTFAGWFPQKGETEITSASKMPAKDTTYYAHWTINKYTVTYDSKDGSAVNSETVDYDTVLTKPTDPTKTGYRFGGWYKEDVYTTQWEFVTDKIADQDITLYAKWDKLFQLSFDANTGVGQMNNVEFISSESIKLPKNTFTKEGFAFTGWNTQADGNGTSYADEATLNKALIADITLYATWKVQAPTVFIDIPKGISLIDKKAEKTAVHEGVVKIVKAAEDVSWYPDEDIQIRTSTNITLSNDDSSYSYEVEVYKEDGSKYTDQALSLAMLNVKNEMKQSAKFTLKTPMNYSKPKGIYKGSMNFIIEFVPQP